MSSTASILSQKLKESVGVAQATVDEDIATCLERLSNLERDVLLLKKVLETTNAALNIQAVRARSQMVEVMMNLANTMVTEHSPEAEHYDKYKSVHEYMDSTLPTKLTEVFEKVVIGPLDAWLQTLVEVRAQHVEFDKQRVVYDHYRDKVSSLQDAKRKTQLKGKVFDKSSEEKLSRNMEKLKEAEGGYTDLRDRSVGRMLQVFQDAKHQLDAVLLRVMQYEKQVFAEGVTCTKAYDGSISQLVGAVKDRKNAGMAVDRLAHCIGIARTAREEGRKLDLEGILGVISPRNPVNGPTSTGSAAVHSRAGSRANSLHAGDDDGGSGAAMSLSSFTGTADDSHDNAPSNGGRKGSDAAGAGSGKASAAVLAARSILAKSASNGGTSSSNLSIESGVTGSGQLHHDGGGSKVKASAPKSPGNPFGGSSDNHHDGHDNSSSRDKEFGFGPPPSSSSSSASSAAPPLPRGRKASIDNGPSGGTTSSAGSTKPSPAAGGSSDHASSGKASSKAGVFGFAKGIFGGGGSKAASSNPFGSGSPAVAGGSGSSSAARLDDDDDEDPGDNGSGKGGVNDSFSADLSSVAPQDASAPSSSTGEQHAVPTRKTSSAAPPAVPAAAAKPPLAKPAASAPAASSAGGGGGGGWDDFGHGSVSPAAAATSIAAAAPSSFDPFTGGAGGKTGGGAATSTGGVKALSAPSAVPSSTSGAASSGGAAAARRRPAAGSISAPAPVASASSASAFGFDDFGSAASSAAPESSSGAGNSNPFGMYPSIPPVAAPAPAAASGFGFDAFPTSSGAAAAPAMVFAAAAPAPAAGSGSGAGWDDFNFSPVKPQGKLSAPAAAVPATVDPNDPFAGL